MARLVVVSTLAIPVDMSVESLLAPTDPSFALPIKPASNDGLHRDQRDMLKVENGETSDSDSDSNDESGDQLKREWSGRADYRWVQTWGI